jgi:hypothetical protein
MLRDWNRNGFLVLKVFFSPDELKEFNTEVSQLYKNRRQKGRHITIDLIEGKDTGKRLGLKDASEAEIKITHKVNDLYLESEACRHLSLNSVLRKILERLLEDEPLVTHYWRKHDVDAGSVASIASGGDYLIRDHLSV